MKGNGKMLRRPQLSNTKGSSLPEEEEECVFAVKYPACNVHVLYCHLRPVHLYSIFPHYLIKVQF